MFAAIAAEAGYEPEAAFKRASKGVSRPAIAFSQRISQRREGAIDQE